MIPTPVRGPMSEPPRITDPRLAQFVSNLELALHAHQQEVAGLQVKLKHFMGILITLLRDKERYPDGTARIKIKDFESITPDTAVDTDEIIGEYGIVRLTNQREYLMKLQGMVEARQVVKVPKRSPYTCQVDAPAGGNFVKVISVCYRGGKMDGKELSRAEGKPKKPREFQCDKDGKFSFTIDSSGFDVEVTYVAKKAPEVAEPTLDPLNCTNDWHKEKDAIGFRCSECGDSRKSYDQALATA